jgi:hypothetical protein
MKRSAYEAKFARLTDQTKKVLSVLPKTGTSDVQSIIRLYIEKYEFKTTPAHVLGVLSGLKTKGLVTEPARGLFKHVPVDESVIEEEDADQSEDSNMLDSVFEEQKKDSVQLKAPTPEPYHVVQPYNFANGSSAIKPNGTHKQDAPRHPEPHLSSVIGPIAKESDGIRMLSKQLADIAERVDTELLNIQEYIDSMKHEIETVDKFRELLKVRELIGR